VSGLSPDDLQSFDGLLVYFFELFGRTTGLFPVVRSEGSPGSGRSGWQNGLAQGEQLLRYVLIFVLVSNPMPNVCWHNFYFS
jgi:hypothetical protein